FIYGGFTFSLYPLCVAHSNDQVAPHELVRTASSLLLVYGMGATVGPFLMGGLMAAFGPAAFLLTLAGMHLALGIYTVHRRRYRPAVVVPGKEPFVMLSRTSQSALEMLPVGAGSSSPPNTASDTGMRAPE